MNDIFIALTAVLGVLSPILCFFKARRYVLYTFVLFCVFTPTIFGFMSSANLLIGGKLWSVLDVQFLFLLLVAYPLSRKYVQGRQFSGIDAAMLVLVLLVGLNFFVGFYRKDSLGGVLNITRAFMFVPVYFAASNILSNPKDVRLFYKLILWFTIGVFVLHILIMFRIYVPPMYQAAYERYQEERYTAVVRPIMFFGEFFYIVGAAVALSHIKYGQSKKLFCYFILLLSLLGTLFTQTRSLYGAMFLVFLAFFGLEKGKLKAVVIIMLIAAALLGTLKILQSRQVEVFARFEGEIAGYRGGWRAEEFGSIARVLASQPVGLLTGQGFGMTHTIFGRTIPYFHNEYLQSIFSLGMIGFICYCYIMFSGILRGHRLCYDRQMASILMPIRIVFFAMAGMAFFFPVLWSAKNCALVASLVAISRNSYWLISQESDQLCNLPNQQELNLSEDYEFS